MVPLSPQLDVISPIDYRYSDPELRGYLSGNAMLREMLAVEVALVKALQKVGICDDPTAREIEVACQHITPQEVLFDEQRIHHDVRALVNCIRERVGDSAKPFVHLTATSADIKDTAYILLFRRALDDIVIPDLKKLLTILIGLSIREAETVQIGRTHGQHAIPITFGFAIAGYVSRLGSAILALQRAIDQLPGMLSGAVGTYAAASLLLPKQPRTIERYALEILELQPVEHSTQIMPREPLARLFSELVVIAGILANLADDMRNLQRSEIAEVGEHFEKGQVGSSTMPQKQNPIVAENIKSCWKIILGRMVTVYMDQISEHQRDLTNSASGRTYPEIIAYVGWMIRRSTELMGKLGVDKERMHANLVLGGDYQTAEALYVILSQLGHANAHAKVMQLVYLARANKSTLHATVEVDPEMQPFVDQFSDVHRTILQHPEQYLGEAKRGTLEIAERWKVEFQL
ncbi:MAG: hypothetical protein A2666_02865 [Parcubacteria group bacterium RIFCSPHIGHO2_01_FULL_47_10b]|nr:MAG: hypothetical protein A2666_02865 [Parcubacteria group bacterium RIFCSPHIGHO2_01_FULL_47_10b]